MTGNKRISVFGVRRIGRAVALAAAAVISLAAVTRAGAQGAAAKLTEKNMSELTLRSLGPTLTPGRVVDVAVDLKNKSVWYVATGSSGFWKTTNRGTTWTPMMDDSGSYSWGCATIDPSNSDIVWAGAGENNSTRSMSYGDGVYKTTDAGRTWKNMGLKRSEHIGKIIVDPRDSNVVYVAAQGPLWAPGGDRGLYKTTDGGATWKAVLSISENTGVSDIAMDPRNPEVVYAASYQRRRQVGQLIGGDTEATIYKTTDGGGNWKKIEDGLPTVTRGRIGIAISPQQPDVVYALVIAAGEESGVFRSTNGGEKWVKGSDWHPTDPQYYVELTPDPHQFDRLYAVDMNINYTEDGGKTMQPATPGKWRGMHVDFHSIWIDPDDVNHVIVGNDGGLYESYDNGQNFHHFQNLPTIQYYGLAVDDALPFYRVYGGAQDNGSTGGPARTINSVGIRTTDWYSVGGGDGMQPRVEPGDPNILYIQSQNGAINRRDLRTGSSTSIRPTLGGGGRGRGARGRGGDSDEDARPQEETIPTTNTGLRFNWDAPVIVSHFSPSRVYFGGNHLFKSDNRGTSWTTISGDLTRNLDRNKIPIMGKTNWPDDPLLKNRYTTDFGVCTALAESPIKEGLLFFGSDDGLIQISEDDGKTWRKIDSFPGVPEMTYVSDICPSSFDANTLYASFENHQRGDFKPYLLKSTDLGRTWTSIAATIPDRDSVWSIVEDFKSKDVLFAGTEFALFFSVDGGGQWIKVSGAPVTAFRDLEIQKRENDLVAATFGRGFYVLDDYSALRGLTPAAMTAEGTLLPARDAYLFTESGFANAAGTFTTPNPPIGASLTYFLSGDEATSGTRLVLTVSNASGTEVTRIDAPGGAGLHRVNWNLRSSAVGGGGGRGGRGRGLEEEDEDKEAAERAAMAGLSAEEREEMEEEMEAERAIAQAPDTYVARAEALQDAQETSGTQARGGRRGAGGRGAQARGGRGGRGGGGGGPLVTPGKYTIRLGRVTGGGTGGRAGAGGGAGAGGTVTPIGAAQPIEVKPLPGAPAPSAELPRPDGGVERD